MDPNTAYVEPTSQASNSNSFNSPTPPRKGGWRRFIIPATIAGGILLLGVVGFTVVKFTDKPKPVVTTSPQAGVTSTERSALGDNQSSGPTILQVTQVIADQGDFAALTAKALQVTADTILGGNLTTAGNGTFGGNLSATNLTGNGSTVTGVNAVLLAGQPANYYLNSANLQGTIGDGQLSANVALRNSPNTFSAGNTFSGGVTANTVSSGSLTVSGSVSLSGTTTISSLILSAPLTVTNGGTGLSTIPVNGVVYGQGAATTGVAVPSAAGQCLVSTSVSVQFGSCSGSGGSSGVSTLNSLTGDLVLSDTSAAGSTLTINSASTTAKGIAQFDATNFSVSNGAVNIVQNLAVSSAPSFAGLTLSAPLSVGSGGIGTSTLPTNSLIIGQGTGAVTGISSASAGQCLISTSAAPTFQTCPTPSNPVVSVNGLTGALTIAGATGSGATITIDNATTGSKGVASFNAANFSVTSGAVNTIQNIAVGSTPTFAGLNLSAALSIVNGGTGAITAAGARTSLSAAVSGNNSDITSLSGLTTAISSAQGGTGVVTTPTNGQILIGNGSGYSLNTLTAGTGVSISNTAGGITIAATTGGTCASCANSSLSNLSGVAINTSLLPATAGTVNLGSSVVPFGQLSLAGSSANPSTNNFLITGASTSGTRTIRLPDASGTVAVSATGPLTIDALGNVSCSTCLTSGGGGAGGVSSLNTATGALTLQGVSAGSISVIGSTVTIADATAAVKGLAAFNSSNFSVTSGTVNTIQNISSSASPSFAGLSLSTALSITNGGTGAATASGALANLGGAARGANTDITSLGALTTPLSVGQGGLGTATLAAGGVVLGNGNSALSAVTGTNGQCLVVVGTTPTFTTCTGAGGVSSVNNQTGAVTIANSSAASGTVTIDSASATNKGIANFNATNLSVVSGTVNTIQDITTTSAPTFGQLSLTNGGSLALGVSGTTQGSVKFYDGTTSFGATLNSTSLTSAQTISLPNESGTVCLQNSTNCGFLTSSAASGNYIQNQSSTAQSGSLFIQSPTNGTIAAKIIGATSQSVDIFQAINTGAGGLYVSNVGTVSTTAGAALGNVNGNTLPALRVNGSLNTTVVAYIQGASGQTASLLDLKDNAGNVNASFNGAGNQLALGRIAASGTATKGSVVFGDGTNDNFSAIFAPSTLTANQTITLPNESGTVCLANSSNCGFLTGAAASGNYITLQGTTPGSMQTGNFNISGIGIAGSIQTSSIDTASASVLSVGLTNTTGITLAQNVTIAAGKTLAVSNVTAGNAVITAQVTGDATPRFKVDANGQLEFGSGSSATDTFFGRVVSGTLSTSQNLTVGTTSVNNSRLSILAANSGAGIGLVVRGNTSQTADLAQLQDVNGNVNASFNASGNQLTLGRMSASGTVLSGTLLFADGTTDNFGSTLNTTTLTASRTLTLPNESGTICIANSLNCGFLTASAASSAYVALQSTTPGTAQTGNLNLSGIGIFSTAVSTASLSVTGAAVLGGQSDQLPLIIKAGPTGKSGGYNVPLIYFYGSNGNSTLSLGSDGNSNIYLGIGAGASNQNTGSEGIYNTFLGTSSGVLNTLGQQNTYVGGGTGINNTLGSSNSVLGTNSLVNNIGSSNTTVGASALFYLTNGSNNTALGFSAGTADLNGTFRSNTDLQNAAAIGAYSQVQGNNSIVLGSVDIATKVGIGTTLPSNTLSVSPLDYQAGSVKRTNGSAILIGNSTSWASTMVGDIIIFADGTSNIIIGVTDATHVVMSSAFGGTTDAGIVSYRFHRPGFQVTSAGNAYVQNTSITAFQVQTSTGLPLFTADTTNSQVVVGTTSNGITLNPVSGFTAAGTARHTKYLSLNAEYPASVLDAASDPACSAANNGTLTSGLYNSGSTNINYYQWASTQASAQCYDVVAQITVPSDFSAWASSTPVTFQGYTTNTSTGTIKAQIIDTAGTTESGYNYTAETPGSASTWTTVTGASALTGAYTPGSTMIVKLRLTTTSVSTVQLGSLNLSYLSKF